MQHSEITPCGANVKASPLPAATPDLRVETAMPPPEPEPVTMRPPAATSAPRVAGKPSLGGLSEAAAGAECDRSIGITALS